MNFRCNVELADRDKPSISTLIHADWLCREETESLRSSTGGDERGEATYSTRNWRLFLFSLGIPLFSNQLVHEIHPIPFAH